MRLSVPMTVITCVTLFAGAAWINGSPDDVQTTSPAADATIEAVSNEVESFRDDNIRLCQGFDVIGESAQPDQGFAYAQPMQAGLPTRSALGVNQDTKHRRGHESHWRKTAEVPWESLAYGEYIGPYRTPHVADYQLRINDEIDFIYLRTREKTLKPYRMYVGDTIHISSAIDESLRELNLVIRPDGMVSLKLIGQVRVAGKTVADLQDELNEKYTKYVKNPAMVVQVVLGDTPLQDLINSVDARAGLGGQGRSAIVSPDGTVQLPGIGSVPAIGLTLDEMTREVNARYRFRQGGMEVTAILLRRAPRFVYVVGSVRQGGRFELTGPTTAMQGIALAQGVTEGANARQVVVFRRDQNWRLTAAKLDLNGALLGKRPYPSDEIWLRDSDIILVPPKPIQRLSEAVDLYFTRTLYSLFPVELGSFDAGSSVN